MSNTAQTVVSDARPRADLTFRQCLGHFATGVTVVTYEDAEGPQGVTVNSFTSVSLEPALVLVCIDNRSKSIPFLTKQPFAINVLHHKQEDLAWHFAGRRSQNVTAEWHLDGGPPLLAGSLAWLACTPWVQVQAGDHLIVVGRVTSFGARDHDPLCFYRGQFRSLSTQSLQQAE
jgi:flavin reductase